MTDRKPYLNEVRRFWAVQYWYLDEHDCLIIDSIPTKTKANGIAKQINDKGEYKDANVYSYLARYINEPLDFHDSPYDGLIIDDYKWEKIADTEK